MNETLVSRACSSCSVCCEVAEIVDKQVNFSKPAWSPCKYQCSSLTGSCSIFQQQNRPAVCSTFQCSWLRGFGSAEDRPDNSGVMVSINQANGGRWIFVVESKEGSVFSTGKNIILDIVTKINLPAIVSKYSSRPPFDKGDWVIVKDQLLPRTESMRGELVGYLDDERQVGVYQLKME